MKTLHQMLIDNPTLLSFVNVPEPFNNTYLTKMILDYCDDLYPYHQNPTAFYLYGTLWFNTHSWLFAHLANIENAEYSPIENYNRIETIDETIDKDGTSGNTQTNSGSDVRTMGGNDVTTFGGSNGISTDTTVTEQIKGFNSTGYEDSNKTVTDSDTTETYGRTETLAHGQTDTLAHGHVVTDAGTTSEDTTRSVETETHGNIGVTTNQQMITQEVELMHLYNAYNIIVSLFESDNFITVYDDYFKGSASHDD